MEDMHATNRNSVNTDDVHPKRDRRRQLWRDYFPFQSYKASCNSVELVVDFCGANEWRPGAMFLFWGKDCRPLGTAML